MATTANNNNTSATPSVPSSSASSSNASNSAVEDKRPLHMKEIDFTEALRFLPTPEFRGDYPFGPTKRGEPQVPWTSAREDRKYVVFNPGCWFDAKTGVGIMVARAFVSAAPRGTIRTWEGLNEIIVGNARIRIDALPNGELDVSVEMTNVRYLLTHNCIPGLGGEDARLMQAGCGAIYCFFNDVSDRVHDDTNRKMMYLRLEDGELGRPVAGAPHSLRSLSFLPGIQSTRIEKNWSPFIVKNFPRGINGSVDLLHTDICPLRVVSINIETGQALQVWPIRVGNNPELVAPSDDIIRRMEKVGGFHFRGGSPGIAWSDDGQVSESLFVGHSLYPTSRLTHLNGHRFMACDPDEHVQVDEKWHTDFERYYFIFFYTVAYDRVSDAFSVSKVSPMFQPPNRMLKHTKIIFPCGLSQIGDNHFLITYGEGDTRCRGMMIHRLTIDDIMLKTTSLQVASSADSHWAVPDPDFLTKYYETHSDGLSDLAYWAIRRPLPVHMCAPGIFGNSNSARPALPATIRSGGAGGAAGSGGGLSPLSIPPPSFGSNNGYYSISPGTSPRLSVTPRAPHSPLALPFGRGASPIIIPQVKQDEGASSEEEEDSEGGDVSDDERSKKKAPAAAAPSSPPPAPAPSSNRAKVETSSPAKEKKKKSNEPKRKGVMGADQEANDEGGPIFAAMMRQQRQEDASDFVSRNGDGVEERRKRDEKAVRVNQHRLPSPERHHEDESDDRGRHRHHNNADHHHHHRNHHHPHPRHQHQHRSNDIPPPSRDVDEDKVDHYLPKKMEISNNNAKSPQQLRYRLPHYNNNNEREPLKRTSRSPSDNSSSTSSTSSTSSSRSGSVSSSCSDKQQKYHCSDCEKEEKDYLGGRGRYVSGRSNEENDVDHYQQQQHQRHHRNDNDNDDYQRHRAISPSSFPSFGRRDLYSNDINNNNNNEDFEYESGEFASRQSSESRQPSSVASAALTAPQSKSNNDHAKRSNNSDKNIKRQSSFSSRLAGELFLTTATPPEPSPAPPSRDRRTLPSEIDRLRKEYERSSRKQQGDSHRKEYEHPHHHGHDHHHNPHHHHHHHSHSNRKLASPSTSSLSSSSEGWIPTAKTTTRPTTAERKEISNVV